MLSEMLSTQIGYKKSGDYFNHTISVLYFRINGYFSTSDQVCFQKQPFS